MSLEKVYHIRVDHIDITVVKKNMKHMNLSIRAPDGRVRIAAPHRVSDAAIFAFASSKLEWIQSRQKTFVYTPVPELEYISGETLRHFGQNLELQVIYSQMAPRVVYHASARRIEMHI